MHDSSASSHPLKVSWFNFALVTLEVFMIKGAFEHVGHSFESSVWMIRKTSWQFDFEKIEHEERVHFVKVLVSNDPDDFGPFALVDPLGFEYE